MRLPSERLEVMMRLLALSVVVIIGAAIPDAQHPERPLRFAVVGNAGTGSDGQRDTVAQLDKAHASAPIDLVITTGGNVIGSARPQDYAKKFEGPFEAMLKAGVPFFATLGDRDHRDSRFYKLFNMKSRTYYSHHAARQSVLFIALDTSALDEAQLLWLDGELTRSTEAWRIVHLHRPVYSSAAKPEIDRSLREALEPLLVKHRVAAVFAGRDEVYERLVSRHGITHFVVGSTGTLDRGRMSGSSALTARGNDQDHVALVAEIAGLELRFAALSRTGQTVDSGVIARR